MKETIEEKQQRALTYSKKLVEMIDTNSVESSLKKMKEFMEDLKEKKLIFESYLIEFDLEKKNIILFYKFEPNENPVIDSFNLETGQSFMLESLKKDEKELNNE